MKRFALVPALVVVGLLGRPAPAAADVTAFLGFTRATMTESQSARGFAFGVNVLLLGFEFEFARTGEDAIAALPGLTTSMFNALVQTPTTGLQFYVTAGGGFYRERLADETETSFGTNVGGGAKIGLAGPIRLRLDYRVFNLRGSPRTANLQRFYAGLALAF